MRDVYEVLREKEAGLEQVRREVEALRLAVQLVESEGSPDNVAFREDDPETGDNEDATVSMRLRRIAGPLLATFAR